MTYKIYKVNSEDGLITINNTELVKAKKSIYFGHGTSGSIGDGSDGGIMFNAAELGTFTMNDLVKYYGKSVTWLADDALIVACYVNLGFFGPFLGNEGVSIQLVGGTTPLHLWTIKPNGYGGFSPNYSGSKSIIDYIYE